MRVFSVSFAWALGMTLAVLLAFQPTAAPAATAEEIDREVDAALKKLYASSPAAVELSKVAKGIDSVAEWIRPDDAGLATNVTEMLSRSAMYFFPGLGLLKLGALPKIATSMAGRLAVGMSGAAIESAANAGSAVSHSIGQRKVTWIRSGSQSGQV